MSAHQIQHHAGIDPEVRKWDIRNWTPLADLDTGIDWIFGVPRRLWQAVVYTTQFYHKYAERYRKSAKVGTSDYGFRKSEFAIKALYHRGILTGKWRAKARFPQASADVGDLIEAVKYDVPSGKRRQVTSPPNKITLHGLRHVAVTSYMESLTRHRFLKRNQGSPLLSMLPGPRLQESLRSACSYIRARNRSSRPPSASTFVHLAEQWLFWARHIRSVRQASYALTCPNHPPFFTDADHSRVRNAMDAEQLSPTKNGMQTVDGSTIMRFNRKESYTADWVVGKGRIWRSRQ